MAALADPLFSELRTVDRREEVADANGEKGSHPRGWGRAAASTKPGSLPRARVISNLSQNGLSQNGYGVLELLQGTAAGLFQTETAEACKSMMYYTGLQAKCKCLRPPMGSKYAIII